MQIFRSSSQQTYRISCPLLTKQLRSVPILVSRQSRICSSSVRQRERHDTHLFYSLAFLHPLRNHRCSCLLLLFSLKVVCSIASPFSQELVSCFAIDLEPFRSLLVSRSWTFSLLRSLDSTGPMTNFVLRTAK